jgi:prophage maintenance system killer protein
LFTKIVYPDYDGVVAINKEIVKDRGGKFAIINEGNLRYCVETVVDKGTNSDLILALIHKAAFYLWCFCLNHSFSDYNKTTAYEVAYIFLKENGHPLPDIEQTEVTYVLSSITTKRVTIDWIRAWVSKHIKPNSE